MSDKRLEVAETMRRVREEVRRKSLLDGTPPEAPSAPPAAKTIEPLPKPASPTPEPAPEPPDAAPLNNAWQAELRATRGIRGVLFRLLDRLLGPRFEAQQVFNARQVQLDNDILGFLAKRVAATHRHYDGVLGIYARHLEEIDTRHLILQQELITRVEDLVQRMDLGLTSAERSRVSLERDLREQRRRIERLEASLADSDPQKK